MLSKAELRQWALGLDPPTETESDQIVGRAATWLEGRQPGLVLVYLSMPGEIRAERVVGLVGDRHRFATSRTPGRGPLTIHPFSAPRERHRFGYEQPVADSPTIDPSELTVVLAPGLTFDLSGNRIGWGKGYYDQLLSETPAVRVGLTLERRLTTAIPVEDHDRPMDVLVTEARVVEIDRGMHSSPSPR